MSKSNFFKSYRKSIIIKNHTKLKHVEVGDRTYYAGYYHGKAFDECVLYMDEDDNNIDAKDIDRLIIGKFCSIATGVQLSLILFGAYDLNPFQNNPP